MDTTGQKLDLILAELLELKSRVASLEAHVICQKTVMPAPAYIPPTALPLLDRVFIPQITCADATEIV